MNPDGHARSLQNKVQFDIRLYFAQRGCENMEKMKTDDFQIEFHTNNELWYVIKKRDELTKNHKDIEALESGLMLENKTDRMCPVRSFRMYLQHLNPDNKFLWQTPLKSPHPQRPEVWYGLQHIGKNTLGKFMTDLSAHCNLSKIYTNHSIRVTGITVLTRMKFSSSEIMSVSGHKSVQSLTNYQRTQPKQKIEMGHVLYQSMTRSEQEITRPSMKELPTTSMKSIKIPHSVVAPRTPVLQDICPENAVIPFEPNFDNENDIPDFDLMAMLHDFEEEHDKKNVTGCAPGDSWARSCQVRTKNTNNIQYSLLPFQNSQSSCMEYQLKYKMLAGS